MQQQPLSLPRASPPLHYPLRGRILQRDQCPILPTLGKRITLTCMDISHQYLAVASNTGSIYIYRRQPSFLFLKMIALDDLLATLSPISSSSLSASSSSSAASLYSSLLYHHRRIITDNTRSRPRTQTHEHPSISSHTHHKPTPRSKKAQQCITKVKFRYEICVTVRKWPPLSHPWSI